MYQLRCFFVVVVLLLGVQSAVSARPFMTAELEGQWYVFSTEVNMAAQTMGWTYGEFEMNGNGEVLSGNHTDAQGNVSTFSGGRMTLDQRGVARGVINMEMPDTTKAVMTAVHGKIDHTGTTGAYIGMTATEAAPEIPVALCLTNTFKAGGSFTQADLQGEWHAMSTVMDVAGGVFWIHGTFTVDGAGNVSAAPDSYHNPLGKPATVTGGFLNLDAEGRLIGAIGFTFEDPDTPGNNISINSQLVAGKMDEEKSSAAYVARDLDTDAPNNLRYLEVVYLAKAGGDFTAADNVGNWMGYVLTIETATREVFPMRGEFYIDAEGNTGGAWISPDGTVSRITGGTTQIDENGVSTGTMPLSTGETITIVKGKMDMGKTRGMAVSLSDNNMMLVGLNFKDTYRFPWPAFLPGIIGGGR